MSLSTYSDLCTSVANWLNRTDLTAIIPDLVLLGEKRALRKLRIREMETALAGTIANGVLAVPDDYIELKSARIASAPVSKLKRASLDQLYEQFPNRSAGGKPQLIAREGANFVFGPFPDGGYDVAGIYYARPDSIQSSANAVFLACPDAYLFGALCEAAPYLKDDERVQLWEAKFLSVVEDANAEARAEDASGGGMAVRPG